MAKGTHSPPASGALGLQGWQPQQSWWAVARRRRGLGGAGVDRAAFIRHVFTRCCRYEVSWLAQANRDQTLIHSLSKRLLRARFMLGTVLGCWRREGRDDRPARGERALDSCGRCNETPQMQWPKAISVCYLTAVRPHVQNGARVAPTRTGLLPSGGSGGASPCSAFSSF